MRARMPRRSGGSIAARLRDLERAALPRVSYVVEAGDLSEAAIEAALARRRAAHPNAGPVVLVPEGSLRDVTPEEWQQRWAPPWAKDVKPIVLDAAPELRECAVVSQALAEAAAARAAHEGLAR